MIKQASEGSHHVPGIVEAKVDNIKDVWSVLQAGSNARVVGSNNVNELPFDVLTGNELPFFCSSFFFLFFF